MSTKIVINCAKRVQVALVAGDYVNAYDKLGYQIIRCLYDIYIDAKYLRNTFVAVSHFLPKREGELTASGCHDDDTFVSVAPEYLEYDIDNKNDVDFHKYALDSLSVFISAFNEISREKIPYKVDLASCNSIKDQYTALASNVNLWFYCKNNVYSLYRFMVKDTFEDSHYGRLCKDTYYGILCKELLNTNNFGTVVRGYLRGSEDDLAFCQESYKQLYRFAKRFSSFSSFICDKHLSVAIESLKL